MMETVIAVGVGVVVGGGILTLVWRILLGDREQRRLDDQLSNLGAKGLGPERGAEGPSVKESTP